MNHDELLNSQQAVEYLKKKWGLKHWTVNAFRQYRHRHNIESPLPKMPNSALWPRSFLDTLPRPESEKGHRGNAEDPDGGTLDTACFTMVSFV